MLTQTTTKITFNLDTEEMFQFIARNNGVSLTDIVSTLYPKWDLDKWTKQAIHGMIKKALLNTNRVFVQKNPNDKRVVLYFKNCKYVETSKRVIFANFIRQMKQAKW